MLTLPAVCSFFLRTWRQVWAPPLLISCTLNEGKKQGADLKTPTHSRSLLVYRWKQLKPFGFDFEHSQCSWPLHSLVRKHFNEWRIIFLLPCARSEEAKHYPFTMNTKLNTRRENKDGSEKNIINKNGWENSIPQTLACT